MQKDERSRVLAQAVDVGTLKADLERYCQLALSLGASGAVVMPADQVIVDERVRLKCVVPRCARAGQTPNCPPYAPDLDLVRKALGRYHYGILFKCDVGPMEKYIRGKQTTEEQEIFALSYHAASGKLACDLERQAFKDGYHLAMSFGGGSCKDYLCHGKPCQYMATGSCLFPIQSRPAMEAVGIDVSDLINKAGWQSYALLDDLASVPCAITVGIVFVR